MPVTPFVCVPIHISLYNELVLRVGDPNRDVSPIIESIIESYLERTEADGDWSAAYYAWKESKQPIEEFERQFGDPAKGYYWTPLFLPNGTRLSMPYGGTSHDAEIRHERIFFGETEVATPSALASLIASGTSRNAWRDLRIKRPEDAAFRLADDLRRDGARK